MALRYSCNQGVSLKDDKSRRLSPIHSSHRMHADTSKSAPFCATAIPDDSAEMTLVNSSKHKVTSFDPIKHPRLHRETGRTPFTSSSTRITPPLSQLKNKSGGTLRPKVEHRYHSRLSMTWCSRRDRLHSLSFWFFVTFFLTIKILTASLPILKVLPQPPLILTVQSQHSHRVEPLDTALSQTVSMLMSTAVAQPWPH